MILIKIDTSMNDVQVEIGKEEIMELIHTLTSIHSEFQHCGKSTSGHLMEGVMVIDNTPVATGFVHSGELRDPGEKFLQFFRETQGGL